LNYQLHKLKHKRRDMSAHVYERKCYDFVVLIGKNRIKNVRGKNLNICIDLQKEKVDKEDNLRKVDC